MVRKILEAIGAAVSFIATAAYSIASSTLSYAVSLSYIALIAVIVCGAAFVYKVLSDKHSFPVPNRPMSKPQEILAGGAYVIREVCGEYDRENGPKHPSMSQ